jgi:uncharacterized repeat protein (TIGR01451 family)
MTNCQDGDTYVVVAKNEFRLLMPIVGQILGNTLTLSSEAQARVLNLAFDPTPGASVIKEACVGATCTDFAQTPVAPGEDLEEIFVQANQGDTIRYRITVANVGGEVLTGVTMADVQGGSPYTLPLGTANCPAFPTAMAVAASWQCIYSVVAPNPGGPAVGDFKNTATVNATNLDEPRAGEAIVKVIAAPAQLVMTKYVSVYSLGGQGAGPFGTATNLTAQRSTRVPTDIIWYRIIVGNPGGQTLTNFTLADTSGLPSDALCPARPASLLPNQSYTCTFSKTYSTDGTRSETATATGGGLTATASSSVVIQPCATGLVIPNLVGITGRTNVTNAWGPTGAGFTGTLTTWGGNPNQTVATQTVTAYSCAPATQTMTASP